MGSISVWHWLIVALIVALVFGTKKLRTAGSDLGFAVKGFKDGLQGGQGSPAEVPHSPAVSIEDRHPGVVDGATMATSAVSNER